MFWYFKNSAILAFISTIVFSILGYIEAPDFSIILQVVYSFFLGAIPNAVFLFILCLFDKEYKVYYRLSHMILEVILCYIIGLLVKKSIAYIPEQYRFEVTQSYTSIRSFFTSPYIEIYQYIILFLVLFFIKRFFFNKVPTNS